MQELKLIKTIQSILSKEFQKDLLPEFGLVTIVGVKVSKDFSFADVYISSIPKNSSVINFLNSKIGRYQKVVNLNLQRRVVPKIRLHYDELGDYLNMINKII